jgi:hypothetical protein
VSDAAKLAPAQIPLDLLHGADQRFLAAIREIVSPLAVRFADQDRALDRVPSRIDTIAQDVAHLKQELRYRRRNLRGATKRRHLIDIAAMGSVHRSRNTTTSMPAAIPTRSIRG